MIKFEYQYDENHPKITVELHADSTLDEVFEQFKGFLLAAGYSFDGDITLTEEPNVKS